MPEPKAVQFGVAQFSRFASDTAHLLQHGLELMGFDAYGRHFPPPRNRVDVRAVCRQAQPDMVFLQGINMWNASMPQPPSKDLTFINWQWLGEQPHIYRLTNLCDPCSHQDAHRRFHDRLRPHAVLTRYDLANVGAHNPWIPKGRLARIYHSVTREYCPRIAWRDKPAILAGCLGSAIYPMRTRLYRAIRRSRLARTIVTLRRHHGYARTSGPAVPAFMQALARHKVCIVGTSRWRWALKKHFEATAAGCIVVTNLPESERLPVIDENLVRVDSDIALDDLIDLVGELGRTWALDRQRDLAARCIDRYDYRVEARRIHALLKDRWLAGDGR